MIGEVELLWQISHSFFVVHIKLPQGCNWAEASTNIFPLKGFLRIRDLKAGRKFSHPQSPHYFYIWENWVQRAKVPCLRSQSISGMPGVKAQTPAFWPLRFQLSFLPFVTNVISWLWFYMLSLKKITAFTKWKVIKYHFLSGHDPLLLPLKKTIPWKSIIKLILQMRKASVTGFNTVAEPGFKPRSFQCFFLLC